ncbi:hypothetical protein XA68_11214 [Ophiocordyceps unilateralis]|uniref:Uncharacterized protein n=1 Tax=Ophiocordyceps unilateralis TaxID=268505 RepID=A0A2A9PN32_OPHUN|nr:hypothetical protein XA68_11214 [Ophiocordyceps unilateralis]
MAPKPPFKAQSLKKFIDDYDKGMKAKAEAKQQRPTERGSTTPPNTLFDKIINGNDSDSDDDDESTSGSSSDGDGTRFLSKLGVYSVKKPVKKPAEKDEIADSDDVRGSSQKKASAKAIKPDPDNPDESATWDQTKASVKAIKREPDTSDESTDDSESDENEPEVKASDADSDESESEEDASDSDSDDSEPKVKANNSEPSSSSSSESESDDSDAKVKTGDSKPSSSSDSESESDDESDSSDASEPAATTKVSAASDIKTQTKASKVNGKPKSGMGKAIIKQPLCNNDNLNREFADESVTFGGQLGVGQVAPPKLIAPDFVLRRSNDGARGEDVARACDQAQKDGSQFWYFTIPPSASFSVVQNLEMPMDFAQHEERDLSLVGNNYGISVDRMTPKNSIQILIPSVKGSQYQAAQETVDQVMQVRRVIQLGDGDFHSTTGPEGKPPPRPQPKGLQASFQPIGVNSPMGSIGIDDGDYDMTDIAPTMPATLAQIEQAKSNKDGNKEMRFAVEEAAVASGSRNAKRKRTESVNDEAAAAAQLLTESQQAESQTKKKPKTARDRSPELGSEPPKGLVKHESAMVAPARPNFSGPSTGIATTPSAAAATTPSAAAASTPTVASTTRNGKAKKTRKKMETPVASSSQTLPAMRMTPVPLPRQTAVPLPPMLSSASLRMNSPVPLPQQPTAPNSKGGGEVKKRPDKEGLAASKQMSSMPSTQAAEQSTGEKQTAASLPALTG